MLGFHGDVVLQANRFNLIRPNGILDIMDMLKDMKHMDMHLLPKILTCTMGAILDMEITSSQGPINNNSKLRLLYCHLRLILSDPEHFRCWFDPTCFKVVDFHLLLYRLWVSVFGEVHVSSFLMVLLSWLLILPISLSLHSIVIYAPYIL